MNEMDSYFRKVQVVGVIHEMSLGTIDWQRFVVRIISCYERNEVEQRFFL
jgi:hypothetical protein